MKDLLPRFEEAPQNRTGQGVFLELSLDLPVLQEVQDLRRDLEHLPEDLQNRLLRGNNTEQEKLLKEPVVQDQKDLLELVSG